MKAPAPAPLRARRIRRRAGLLLAGLLLAAVAGCGSDDPDPHAAPVGDVGDESAADTADEAGVDAEGAAGEASASRIPVTDAVPLSPRSAPVAVWTGSQALVIGGVDEAGEVRRDGAAYTPGDGWQTLPEAPVPVKATDAAVWTGEALLIIGAEAVLARYEPDEAAWTTFDAPADLSRVGAVAGWTGSQLLVVGGTKRAADAEAPPGPWAYDPVADTWRALPEPPGGARVGGVGAWTTEGLVLTGGRTAGFEPRRDTVLYDPEEDAWRELDDAPDEVTVSSVVPAGDELIAIAGGRGAALDPAAGTWRTIAAHPPLAGTVGQLVWTGQQVLVVGGLGVRVEEGSVDPAVEVRERVAVYDPAEDTWSELDPPPIAARQAAAVLWAGDGLFIWGGDDGGFGGGDGRPGAGGLPSVGPPGVLTRFADGAYGGMQGQDWTLLAP